MPKYYEFELRGILYLPWCQDEAFMRIFERAKEFSGVDIHRMWVLHTMSRQCFHVPGDYLEAGVAGGGSALMISESVFGKKKMHLFDTWKGLPAVGENDRHSEGEMAEVGLEECKRRLEGNFEFYPGIIPQTFAGLDDLRFSFAHVDVDLHDSVMDSCNYIYPRMNPGGVMVFDDYGEPMCPGARLAVDTFFADKPEVPLQGFSSQVVVFKLPQGV